MTTIAKADALYDLKYRAEPCGSYLILTTPTGRVYRIDPARNTCSCPASVTCKHLRGWHGLLWAQADAICYEMMLVDDAGPGCRTDRGYTALGHERRRAVLALSERAWGMRLAADAMLAGAREERIAA